MVTRAKKWRPLQVRRIRLTDSPVILANRVTWPVGWVARCRLDHTQVGWPDMVWAVATWDLALSVGLTHLREVHGLRP